jgi:hypothetical protein
VLEIGLDDGKGAFRVVVRLHYFFSGAAAWPVSSLAVDPAALQAPFNTLCSDRCSTTSRSYQRATSMTSGVDGHQLNRNHQINLNFLLCPPSYTVELFRP